MAIFEKGTVIGSDSGFYEVYTENQEKVVCKPRGRFRHDGMRLLVGDKVELTKEPSENVCISKILERKNHLLRPPIANLDVLFIVVAAESPAPLYLNIDKLTAIAEENKIKPEIIVSKSDLSAESAQNLVKTYQTVGYPVWVTAINDVASVEKIRNELVYGCKDLVCAFAGASGVGKSTLLNALFPQLNRKTGTVNEKIGRGRHTTRSVTLFPLCELVENGRGFLADTPGFTMLDFENFDFFGLEELPYNFVEFKEYIGTCKYTKCTHRKEEGCRITEAVEKGVIAKSRKESYCLLYEQLKNKHDYKKQSR